jgi:hypothetical protein
MGQFLDVLDEQGSLLSLGQAIWTPPNLADLSERVVGHPDFGRLAAGDTWRAHPRIRVGVAGAASLDRRGRAR